MYIHVRVVQGMYRVYVCMCVCCSISCCYLQISYASDLQMYTYTLYRYQP